ncbi:MAG: hypothetical protein CM1200mP10_13810 [Candidatus Neomarinimicrobiota bacterium]|nr:MAG: hypothetical protein CM1200mP10_13810 [Candidatus Neomarinimicrobiota bacterium]
MTANLTQVALGQMTQAEALTATGNVLNGYVLTVLEGLGVNLNDSDHDYSPAGTVYQETVANDVLFDGVFDGAVIEATPIHSQQELNHGQALPTKIQLSIHSASQVAVRSPLQGQLVTQ